MKIIEPSFEILQFPEDISILEIAGRTCYKSEVSKTKEQSNKFIKRIVDNGHESVIEHCSATVKIICDRGVSHELVRHRIASYSQESTRYCNYSQDKFDNEITFIRPSFWQEGSIQYEIWKNACKADEIHYINLISLGSKPEEARSVLPNSLKTEIVVTANFRSWRNIFRLRRSDKAHPDIRYIMKQIQEEFIKRCPVIFE